MPQHDFIPGLVGRLQIIYRQSNHDLPAVLICHPHPQHGGTMHNKVTYCIAKAFSDKGHAVLRFNFRGVDLSEGEWADGVGEVEDAKACIDWLAEKHSKIWLAGFSFGAYAGLKAVAEDERVERLFAVAPAVSLYDFSFLDNERRPLTVVHGTDDEIVPYDQVSRWALTHPTAVLHSIDEAGHFFLRHTNEMLAALLLEVT
ncbi:MAG: alpha/beta fold hydrolase [Gammaproteobacteria bacterium]|nr:alpha/beta fold hydrolase [Gammaproteobacteria bacterium]